MSEESNGHVGYYAVCILDLLGQKADLGLA
jgi:hypothetical protein